VVHALRGQLDRARDIAAAAVAAQGAAQARVPCSSRPAARPSGAGRQRRLCARQAQACEAGATLAAARAAALKAVPPAEAGASAARCETGSAAVSAAGPVRCLVVP